MAEAPDVLLLPTHIRFGGEREDIVDSMPVPILRCAAFPVLSRALENMKPATTLRPELEKGFENYQQIFRSPFVYRIDGTDFGAKAEAALQELFRVLEQTLIHGTPEVTDVLSPSGAWPVRFMGGVRHYLGRDLEPWDTIELRPLQMPALYLMRGVNDATNDVVHTGEWLCETSLYVKRGEPVETTSNPNDIRIVMDLERLGELIGAIAMKLTQIRDIEPPDFDGDEMRQLAVAGWKHCVHMHDRAEFAASVQNDLAALDEVPTAPEPPTKHYGFGFDAPV